MCAKRLDDKVILLVGGIGLLGREFTKGLCHHNAKIIVADINSDTGTQFVETIKEEFVESDVTFQELDITSLSSVKSILDFILQKYGRLDAVVNNAYPRNKNYGNHFFEVSYGDFNNNVSMNLGGLFLVSQQCSRLFLQQKHGNVVNIASIYGVVAPDFSIYEGTSMTSPVEYAAIKSAVIHLTKYMANYFKGKNIRVNSISLGGLLDGQDSNFIKAYSTKCLNKGMLTPSDILGSLVYLLSDESLYVNGHNLVIDDGFTL
jgi:NAD(P)-dependent dehydrogenase (short-subunit alcohol dehydrogenase family)